MVGGIKVSVTIDWCPFYYVFFFFSGNVLFLFRFDILAAIDTFFIMKKVLPELSGISSDFAFRIYKFNDTSPSSNHVKKNQQNNKKVRFTVLQVESHLLQNTLAIN